MPIMSRYTSIPECRTADCCWRIIQLLMIRGLGNDCGGRMEREEWEVAGRILIPTNLYCEKVTITIKIQKNVNPYILYLTIACIRLSYLILWFSWGKNSPERPGSWLTYITGTLTHRSIVLILLIWLRCTCGLLSQVFQWWCPNQELSQMWFWCLLVI